MIETREKGVRRIVLLALGPVVEDGAPCRHLRQPRFSMRHSPGRRTGMTVYPRIPGCLNPDDSFGPAMLALPVEFLRWFRPRWPCPLSDGQFRRLCRQTRKRRPIPGVCGQSARTRPGRRRRVPAAPHPQGRIEWLGSVQTELGERNGDGKPVRSHRLPGIPPQEFYDCLKEVPAWTPNAVERRGTHAGRCCVLNHEVCRPGSQLRRGDRLRRQMWARWMPCARLAAISRCSAGMTIKTLSLVMCMTSIWAMHPRAGSRIWSQVAVPRRIRLFVP